MLRYRQPRKSLGRCMLQGFLTAESSWEGPEALRLLVINIKLSVLKGQWKDQP